MHATYYNLSYQKCDSHGLAYLFFSVPISGVGKNYQSLNDTVDNVYGWIVIYQAERISEPLEGEE